MKIAASQAHRTVSALMLVAALAYLVPFVPRGWIPHDEGMLAYSAERVLLGDLPHVDFEESYTGGLSWLYALVFKVAGVDLVNLRWLLFAAAALAVCQIYAILCRYLPPAGAALVTWVALGWSFPNYFAGLPSWWLLVCALTSLWAMIRYGEVGRIRHIVIAGLAAGVAVVIKQTGVYLFVALVITLLYDGGRSSASGRMARLEWAARCAVAIGSVAFAASVLFERIFRAEGLYLFLPVLACAVVLLIPSRQPRPADARSPFVLVAVAAAVAALPLACLLVPYAIHGKLDAFVAGTLVLPLKRAVFASTPMPGASAIMTGLPLAAVVFAGPRFTIRPQSTALICLLWGAAIALPLFALWDVRGYQLIWQSSRAIAALLPLGIAWRLASGRSTDAGQRSALFLTAAIFSWMSLNQFPFAAPIYFCYVAPLAVIAGAATVSSKPSPRSPVLLSWMTVLLLFAVLSANRGYLVSLGAFHTIQRFDTDLKIPRAHLKVDSRDAGVYRFLIGSIQAHLGYGQLIAGPDCPEVYFLSQEMIPSGRLFDFFSADTADRDADLESWVKGRVIVVNHAPNFSPPLSEALLTSLRREFPYGESIGRFEIRWR